MNVPIGSDQAMTPDMDTLRTDPMSYAPTSLGASSGNRDVTVQVEAACPEQCEFSRRVDLEAEAHRAGKRRLRESEVAWSASYGSDIGAVMELCSADATITDELAEIDENIAQLIRELGGSVRGYRSGRRGKIMNLVSEIHSAPRVTRAFKLFPELGLLP